MSRRTYRKSKNSTIIKILIAVFGIAAALMIYFYMQYQYFISTPVNSQNTDSIGIIIKKGDSTSAIAHKLVENKLILNEDSFKWYARLNNLDKKIVTGRFLLSQNMTVPEIADEIINPEQKQVVLTIPEGSTVYDINAKLVENDLIKGDEFETAVKNFNKFEKYPFIDKQKAKNLVYPLEGYLFPDTYFVNPSEFSNESLIQMMLNNYSSRIKNLDFKSSKRSASDILIVASMIEKEANKDIDRPLISDIIWKRLDANWQLGIDATLLYLKNDREIDYKDLQEKTPYNTRINTGLPPGPICNPGLASIKAALEPETNEYFYYLTSSEGKMVYAKTLSEHNNNKAKYL